MIPYAEVIGDPIAHSRSPAIHRLWLDMLGIAGDYRAHRVTGGGLVDYFSGRRNDPAWRGCNITIPHKIAALDQVGDPGNIRGTIGAINTVIRDEDGLLIGTNTDVGGFAGPLMDRDWSGAHAAVVGTGGAAHAVLYGLRQLGFAEVTVLARRPLIATALLARMGIRGAVQPLDARLPPVDLLVNATSLGMTGQPPLMLDLTPLPADALVYDIVYIPQVTPLLAAAAARELATIDGLDMLVGQAALAFELFFGTPVPEQGTAAARAMLIR